MTKKAIKLRNSKSDISVARPHWTWRPVKTFKAYDLSFNARNWTVNFDGDYLHSMFRKTGQLANLCNIFGGKDRIHGYLGRHHLRLVQGIRIHPADDDDMKPFFVYATNTYGVTRGAPNTKKSTGRFDVIEVDDGNDGSFFRLVMAILIYGEGPTLGCEIICVDLELCRKDDNEALLPYDLYQIRLSKNGYGSSAFCWSSNSVESIKRPVCFNPTIEIFIPYKKWCKGEQQYTFNMLFWCFPYNYCDRSNWNEFTHEERDHIEMGTSEVTRIMDVATLGINYDITKKKKKGKYM